MAPCHAHGHADALSVLFTFGEEDILIDPGNYSYTGKAGSASLLSRNIRTQYRDGRWTGPGNPGDYLYVVSSLPH